MIYYTSDLHLGHENVIFFDKRPFKDRDEMDRVLIDNWNSRVEKDDTVYIVGDFCYRSGYSADWYLKKMKGHKVLIIGNHDGAVLKNSVALSMFDSVEKMMEIKDGDKRICLCHYPIAEWDGFFHETWHIYGHIHNNKNASNDYMKNQKRALNAGCMINSYMPVSFDELVRNNELYHEESIDI